MNRGLTSVRCCSRPQTREEVPDRGAVTERDHALGLLLLQPDLDLEMVAGTVRADADLSGRVLRLANSAAFGGRLPARDIGEAIARIGLSNLVGLLPGSGKQFGLPPALELEVEPPPPSRTRSHEFQESLADPHGLPGHRLRSDRWVSPD